MERYGSIESVLWAEIVELGAALDAEREKVKELKEWQRVVVGTGTDQEAVVRMAATEYTKTAVQCWKDENAKLTAQLATLQAQLRQVEGASVPRSRYDALNKDWLEEKESARRLKEVLAQLCLEMECSRNSMFVQMAVNVRATLAAQDASEGGGMIIYERAGIYPPSEGDVPIHCLYCGWIPIEGMKEYLSIHADKADCIRCKRLLPHDPPFIDPYEASKAGGDGE